MISFIPLVLIVAVQASCTSTKMSRSRQQGPLLGCNDLSLGLNDPVSQKDLHTRRSEGVRNDKSQSS